MQAFAAKNSLKQVSVADLIAYRQRKETLVERVACSDIDTPGGKAQVFTYTLPWDSMHHVAVVFGDIRDGEDVPVRLHSEDVVSDVFGTSHGLDGVMKSMGERKRGVIVYLREGSWSASPIRSASARTDHEDHEESPPKRAGGRSAWAHRSRISAFRRSTDRLARTPLCRAEGFGIHIAKTEILRGGIAACVDRKG